MKEVNDMNGENIADIDCTGVACSKDKTGVAGSKDKTSTNWRTVSPPRSAGIRIGNCLNCR